MIPFTVKFENGSKAQTIQINNALVEAHYVLDSEEFKKRVLNFSYKNEKGEIVKGFYQAEMSNEEVYEKLMASLWEYSVSFYSKKLTSARAYVNPGDPTVNLNWAKIAGEILAITANTLVHENTHLKGFHHDYESTKLRKFSVPYAIGKIIEDIILGVNSFEIDAEVKNPVVYGLPWYKKILPWNWL